MNILHIEVTGFHGLNGFTLTFPKKGAVVITGANGTGKSTIIEAICWAVWGKTLRGTIPGGDDEVACEVGLTTDEVYIIRRRENGRTQMGWKYNHDGTFEDPAEFPTMSAAQEALESIVGDFGLWVRSRVFSSSDAVYFSMASDKERKRLLEEVLGVDRFDSAHMLCRTDLNTGKGNLVKLEQGSEILQERIKSLKDRISDYEKYEKNLGPTDDLKVLEDKLSKLEEQYKQAQSEVSEVSAEVRSCRKDVITIESKLSFEAEKVENIKDAKCPTCFQDIRAEYRDNVRAVIDETTAALTAEHKTKRASLSALTVNLEELTGDCDLLSEASYHLDTKMRSVIQSTTFAKEAESSKKQLLASKAAHEEEAVSLGDEKSELQDKVDVLGHVATVLNTRGVRAQVVTNALNGLQASANSWLSRLCTDLSIELSGETVQASGKVVDTISLHIHGGGGGNGYKALSSGQRRRVDVALMLGLGAIAEAASGYSGAMMFDEVFDALDSDGVAAIVDVLSEISTDRLVFVVTHNDELANAIPAVLNITTPF